MVSDILTKPNYSNRRRIFTATSADHQISMKVSYIGIEKAE